MADIPYDQLLQIALGVGGTALGGPVGGAIGGGLGTLLGGLLTDAPKYTDIYGNIRVPTAEELAAAGNIEGTAYDAISEDPLTRAAQMRALSYLQGIGESGGMDLQSQVAQQQALARSAQQDQANRQAVMESMARRGQAGSGAELAANLSGAQSSAQANAMAGSQFAADARTRALQAMMGSGQLGGQVRGQDWSNASDRAQARDRIAAFNAQNKRSALGESLAGQMAKAHGQMGASQAQYGRDVALGGAAGTLAGGATGYGIGALTDEERRKKKLSVPEGMRSSNPYLGG